MKKLTTLDEFLNESVKVLTYDGKKPNVVFNVDKLTYEDLHKIVDPKWGQIALPPAENFSGPIDYTIFISDNPDSKMEASARKNFEDWKKEVVKKWGNKIEIFKWNENRNKLIFQFMPGTSKEFDKEMERRTGLKDKMDPNTLHTYYHGPGSKGRYFGD